MHFSRVTVSNHVHLLRVVNGERRDQALFDFSFPKATLRFRPPTPTETAVTEFGAGVMRTVGGLVQVLFLASLVLAARSRRELLAISGMFLAGQMLSALLVPHTGWSPPSRFVEAAAALTLAYLAVEILLLPRAGGRWAIAGLLGAFPRTLLPGVSPKHRVWARFRPVRRGSGGSRPDCIVCRHFYPPWPPGRRAPPRTGFGVSASRDRHGLVFSAAEKLTFVNRCLGFTIYPQLGFSIGV